MPCSSLGLDHCGLLRINGFGMSLSGKSFDTFLRRSLATRFLMPLDGELSFDSWRKCLALIEFANGEETPPDTFELSADPGMCSSSIASPFLFLNRILNFRPATLDFLAISGEVAGEERCCKVGGSIIGICSRFALDETSCGLPIFRFLVDRLCDRVRRAGILAILHSASSGELGGCGKGDFKAAVASEAC